MHKIYFSSISTTSEASNFFVFLVWFFDLPHSIWYIYILLNKNLRFHYQISDPTVSN